MGEIREKEQRGGGGGYCSLIHQRTGQTEKEEERQDERGLKIMRKRERERTRRNRGSLLQESAVVLCPIVLLLPT